MVGDALLTLQLRAGMANRELQQLSQTGCAEQRHLDADTTEQAYWHHGYFSAMVDVIRMMGQNTVSLQSVACAQELGGQGK